MIKKLDKLILKSFIGPFMVTFFIAFFVLTMQTLWKYIDDLVGKGLDFLTIMKFVWYASATLSSLAMPIAILISSIMTFGNLGESFELVAIKSSGVSLLRFMRPLIWVTAILCFITFLFANYVIPYSNLKFFTLYKDIRVKKPSFDLQEGVFYNQLPGYSMRIAKKEKDTIMHDILIYESGNPLQDNTIIAKQGKMTVSNDKNYLEFNLKDGHRYQEKGNFGDTVTEYVRLSFREYKKLFDISILQKQTSNDSALRNDTKMLSARQLSNNLKRMNAVRDSTETVMMQALKNTIELKKMPVAKKTKEVDTVSLNFNDSIKYVVYQRGIGKLSEMKNTLLISGADLEMRNHDIIFTKIEWHRKYAFSLACMVLFFIGAPLGSIIRKGGLGLPLVVAIIFFLIFHLLNMFGEKFARNEILEPWQGMWLSIAVLTPVGIFFTYKAMHDSQLFNKEFYSRVWNKTKKLLPSRNRPKDINI